MMNRIILEEIMKLEPTNEFGIMSTVGTLSKYGKVDLIQDNKFNLFYQIKVSDILLSDITSDELINVRNGGCGIKKDKKFLIKKL